MRIRLSELKQIIRSEVRRSLYESLHADVVGKPPMHTDEDRDRVMQAVEDLINSATEEQLLAVLTAAAEGNQKIPPVVEDGIAALVDNGIQVSHRHRRGIRLYENGGAAIAALLASRLGKGDDNKYLPNAEDAKAKKEEAAAAILAGFGLSTTATVLLSFFGASAIATLGAAGVAAALGLAAAAAIQKARA